jgi:tetratricopeptide (TPR) repeat protein
MPESFDHIAQAVALLQGGDCGGAAGLLKQLLVSAPSHHQALFVMGEALRHAGDNDGAEAVFGRALHLVHFNNGDIFYRLGLARFAAGKLTEAEEALAAAAERVPGSSEIWLSLGNVALQLGHDEAAERALRRAAGESASALENLADLLARRGQEEESLRLLETAPDLSGRVDLVDRVLSIRLQRQEAAQAEAFLLALIEEDPGNEDWHYRLGWLYHSLNRFAESVTAYRFAVALAPGEAEYVANLAVVLRLANAPLEAQKTECARAIALNPLSITAVLGLARLQLDEGDFAAAKQLVGNFDQCTGYPRGPRRSVVIPVLNYSPGSPYNIRTLLEDLRDFDGEVICIFNGDEVYHDLRDHPRIDKFSYNKFNVGVSRGWNMGINQAEGDTIHILNADLRVSVDMLYRLEDYLHKLPDALCVGVSAHWIDPFNLKEVRSYNSGSFTQPIEADSVSGQLFSLHSRRLHDAGISFDPRLTPYFGEEADLFIKARLNGLKIYAVPETDFAHSWGISVRDRPLLCFGRPVHRTHRIIDNQILLQEKARRLLGDGGKA